MNALVCMPARPTSASNQDIRGLSQITFALRVGSWSDKYVHNLLHKKCKLGAYVVKKFQKMQT